MRNLFRFCILLTILASLLGPVTGANAQTPTPPQQVQALFASMTPEERVGQLFLVTFSGTDTSETSQVYDLIANHHIGGVILLSENDNFVAEPDTVASAYRLISELQNIEWNSSTAGLAQSGAFVPLFVGVSQEGDGLPNDAILTGMTQAE